MNVALMLISLFSSIIGFIMAVWFRPLNEQKKAVKKTIYSFLVFGFSISILHI